MQVSVEHHSILMARVSQRPGRLAASFQAPIHGTDARANAALWTRAGLVVAVRAPPERNTAIIAVSSSSHLGCRVSRLGTLHDKSGRMPKLRPLTACQIIL